MPSHRSRTTWLTTLALLPALALASCASDPDTETASGEGVEHGASKAEYAEAFADVDPIVLNTQTPAPKGSVTGSYMELYLEAIEEWSDGKITFETAYSNAIAPPEEIDDALADGRLDLGLVLPIYEPSEYPANAALMEVSVLSDHAPVTGTLQHNAWPNQLAFDTPEILSEFADHDMKLMLPFYTSGSNALLCSEARSDLGSIKGAQVSVGGASVGVQASGLGASPVSVQYTELFESLERGVIDCSMTSMNVAVLGGIIEAAPHVALDPEVGLALSPGAMAMSQATWESLPLAAQQLLWDRLDTFVKGNVADKIWTSTAQASAAVIDAGGSFSPLADDARKALERTNEEILTKLAGSGAVADGEAFVEAAREASDTWRSKVGELGYEDEVDYNEFGTWYTPEKVDAEAYAESFYDEILLPHRP
ncbi:TRAP transporter substrate-binding protein DctP [Nocardioides sp. W7]|uniref:TRAP transporter substrate-binding protein DctP n=1 Tax=Nocardioides sp. W7 TaxID=2931390 RepID=UPI001FD5DE13|nr:TRAP transporter substrate-binding protein DctP [Nocardioides sp. W7]